MTRFIVPVSQGGAIQVTEEMKRDAAATDASMEGGGGAYIYLVQHDSTAVTERQEAKGGDWLVSGAGDKAINLGSKPQVIILSQHIRYVRTGKKPDKNGQMREYDVWNLAWEAMTAEQQKTVDLPWEDPNSSRPVDTFLLLHVDQNGIDPHKIGVFRYQPKKLSAKDAKKWTSDAKAEAARGVPSFAQVWEMGSVMTKTNFGGSKLAATHAKCGVVPGTHPLYVKLKESWLHAQTLRKQAMSQILAAADGEQHTEPSDESLGNMADENAGDALGRGQSMVSEMTSESEYATTLPSDDEEPPPVKQATVDLPPAIPGDTVVVIEADDGSGKPAKGKLCDLTVGELRLSEAYYARIQRDMQGSPNLPQVKARLAAVQRRMEHLNDVASRAAGEPEF